MSTFTNLLISDLSFPLEECLLLLLTSLLKRSVLVMDESLPALHLELLGMFRETVELVMLLPWNLQPPPALAPILFYLVASNIHGDLLLPSALTLLFLKRNKFYEIKLSSRRMGQKLLPWLSSALPSAPLAVFIPFSLWSTCTVSLSPL